MAEPAYTPEQRQDILRYRRLKTADTMQRVGAVTGNAGRTIQGKDPFYKYTPPGADNLTEEQKAKLRAQYAEILAKLAQAEREATSSDQSLEGQRIQGQSELFKALMGLAGTYASASGGVAQEKVQAETDFANAAIDQETKARESQRLSPAGQAAVFDFAQQAQEGGFVNASEVAANMEKDLRVLYKENPAQVPAYIDNVERAARATGRPELANFSLEAALSGGLGGKQLDTTLAASLNQMMRGGDTAYATANALQRDGAERREKAHDILIRQNAAIPKELKALADTTANYLSEAPGAQRAYVKAPPTDATPDEKRAYVEKASQGQATVDDSGVVVSKASPGQSMAYDAFVQSNPMVDQQGTRATGAPGPMLPSGSSSSRSGPTADTIASIRKLRENIELQVKNLDNVNQDPLSKARAGAEAVVAGVDPDAYAKNPEWALKAAGRTAAAEQRKDTRGLRADRDASILQGETNAPLTEKSLAVVRSIPRAIGRGARAAVEGLRKDRPESVEGLSPGRDVTFRPSEPELEGEQEVALRPSAVEMEGDIPAPDMEALAAKRAAAEQRYTEEVEPLLDEAPAPPPSQQRAQLRGTTLSEARATDPRLEDRGRLIGDVGTSARINQATAGPDLEEAGSEVPRVPFQRQPFATPAPRKPVGEVTTAADFESTGGDEKTRTGPASAADVGAAAAQAPTRGSVLRSVGKALQDKPEERAAPKDEVKFDTDIDSWLRFQKRVSALPPANPALERLDAAKAAVRGMPAPGERPSTDMEDYAPVQKQPSPEEIRRSVQRRVPGAYVGRDAGVGAMDMTGQGAPGTNAEADEAVPYGEMTPWERTLVNPDGTVGVFAKPKPTLVYETPTAAALRRRNRTIDGVVGQ